MASQQIDDPSKVQIKAEIIETTMVVGAPRGNFASLRSECIFCVSLFMSQITAVRGPAVSRGHTTDIKTGVFCIWLQSDRPHARETIFYPGSILHLAIHCICLDDWGITVGFRTAR